MRIELEEDEIKRAIIEYVSSQGLPIDPESAEVDLKNARGDFGATATISVTKPEATNVPAEPKKLESVPGKIDTTELGADDDDKSIFNS